MASNAPLPLTGLKILDLTRVLAGPLSSMMLGDLGADVIKVERPEIGDETRGWGPPFDEAGESAYYLSTNRNKLSIAAHLGKPADVDLILHLAENADVVLDNFLPGVLLRYGIDSGALLRKFEHLIWCTISGFGKNSARPGYDFVAQAESGWMAITGPVAGPPMKTGVALVDLVTGKDATIAVLGALVGRHRRRSPEERHLHISLKSSATAALVNVAQNALVSGNEAKRWGNAHPNLVPYQLFDTSDQPFVLAVGSDPQWVLAARAMGLEDLADDPSLATNPGRLAHRERLVSRIAERALTAPASHWVAVLEGAGVPCGVVKSVLEALEDSGSSPQTGVPSSVCGTVRRRPPRLDEHGALIRKSGWSAFDQVPTLA